MRAKACAKINLCLEVLGRRSDGYHQVMTVLQTVDLADRLDLERSSDITVECSITALSGEENLAYKAAETLKKASGYTCGAHIQIEKRIPVSMGLGGGSSDAAATLVALNSLWDLNLAAQELERLGRTLGVDVPFFVKGGTSLGEDRGDILRPLKSLSGHWIVLICPEISTEMKTSRMYSMLGSDSYTDGKLTRALADDITSDRLSPDLLFNVFEQVALDFYPGLGDVMRDAMDAGSEFIHLSGTGPALYTVTHREEDGLGIRDKLVAKGHKAWLLQLTEASSYLTPSSLSN